MWCCGVNVPKLRAIIATVRNLARAAFTTFGVVVFCLLMSLSSPFLFKLWSVQAMDTCMAPPDPAGCSCPARPAQPRPGPARPRGAPGEPRNATLPGSLRDYSGITPGLFRAHSGLTPGSLWAHSGFTPGLFRAHSGLTPGLFRAHSGLSPGSLWAPLSGLAPVSLRAPLSELTPGSLQALPGLLSPGSFLDSLRAHSELTPGSSLDSHRSLSGLSPGSSLRAPLSVLSAAMLLLQPEASMQSGAAGAPLLHGDGSAAALPRRSLPAAAFKSLRASCERWSAKC